MRHYLGLLSVLSLALIIEFCDGSMWIVEPGPKYPPTKGMVWPEPRIERKESSYYVLHQATLDFNVTDHTCDIIERAVFRYSTGVGHQYHGLNRHIRGHNRRHRIHHRDANYKGAVPRLHVTLSQPCEELPHFEMNEHYILKVASNVNEPWTLESGSVWGILRGLESFCQLFYLSDDYNEIRINATNIEDFPRYSHRGLLLDTSRHYLSVDKIRLTLEAMAINKMNVFHWHIVDDQSFPYVSETFPDLSALGAFHPSMVYTKNDVELIIDYARDRGIRVVPEFDVPGHTRSWGVAFPQLLTKCYDKEQVIGLGPMNPISNGTYKLLQELFHEVQSRFPDRYFHIGGDEVQLDCWQSNPELQQYLHEHNLTSAADLHALFMERALPLLAANTTAIVWQEVFDEQVPLDKNVLVHIWKSGWIESLLRVLGAGYKVLFSAAWYLDHLKTGGDWEDFYQSDPGLAVMNQTLAQGIVGGEACMWGETVDNNNVISRVWPRVSAVAERLWSEPPTQKIPITVQLRRRLEEHACRMIRRGVAAQPPNGPGFCIGGNVA